MKIHRLAADEWNHLSESAHMICFKEVRPPDFNTCDFALLVTDENDVPVSYATILEIDKKSAYMQHGGAFPSVAKTVHVARSYHLIMAYLKENYTCISTRILNKNKAMLKLAMSADLIINGLDVVLGEIFLNHFWVRGGV